MIAGRRRGRVVATGADELTVRLPLAAVGDALVVRTAAGARIPGTVTRVDERGARLEVRASLTGVAVGDEVTDAGAAARAVLGTPLLGRAVDGLGVPLDGGPAPVGLRRDVAVAPIPAGKRAPVRRPLWTGVRAIDACLTIGRGARIGIFGAPSAGKSTLIEMLVRGTSADAAVVGLVGERGREAATWIERVAPSSTIVCAPLDRSAAERVAAARLAIAQAHALRRRGLHVLFILDSLARYVIALREVATLAGEPVGRGGYPASVWTEMARVLELGGNVDGGSVTIVATVLSDGGDEREPLSDAARAALDGHIVLSPDLARRGHYPAIDVAASVSRTMPDVVSRTHAEHAVRVRRAIAELDRTRDARDLGIASTDPFVTAALAAEAELDAFLRQRDPGAPPETTLAALADVARRLDDGPSR